MDCKDLTICDYVKHDGIIKIVDAVYLYSVSVHDPSEPWGVAKSELVSVDDIEPIKLTEDILVKNGFEKTTNDWNRHRPLIIFESMGFPTISIHADMDMKHFWVHGTIDLTYVHQLQRLLNLCNIDKEIIL